MLVYNISIAERIKLIVKTKTRLSVMFKKNEHITEAARKEILRIKTFLLNLAFVAYIIAYPKKESKKVNINAIGRTPENSHAQPIVLFIP
jgi:hypothetical protein